MRRALALAAEARHTAHPNPMVGAVITDPGGTNVGEGWHIGRGHPHAEQAALEAAGEQARGGTLYVTLEPCTHSHRTPNCTEAVIASGVTRVVVAMPDPDSRVRGEGVARLRAAGVTVDVGQGQHEAEELNRDYTHHRRTGRPFVVVKSAISIEGLQAAADGTSQWITGEAARADAHRLRAEADAVMVGSGTVIADNAALTCRLPGYEGPQPLRVVMDRRGRVPERDGWLRFDGSLKEALAELGRREVVRLLVEGGPTLTGAFAAEGLVDEFVVYVAPLALAGAPTLSAGRRLRLAEAEPIGGDIRLRFFS